MPNYFHFPSILSGYIDSKSFQGRKANTVFKQGNQQSFQVGKTSAEDWNRHMNVSLQGSQISTFQMMGTFKWRASMVYFHLITKIILNLYMIFTVHATSTKKINEESST